MLFIAIISMIQDWLLAAYFQKDIHTPVLNEIFISSAALIVAILGMTLLNRNKKYKAVVWMDIEFEKILNIGLPILLFSITYIAFRREIAIYFDEIRNVMQNDDSSYPNILNVDNLKVIWNLSYSLFFFTLLSLLNIRFFKSKIMSFVLIGLNTLTLILFFTQGLYVLGELRFFYLHPESTDFQAERINLYIRYVGLLLFGLLLWYTYLLTKQDYFEKSKRGLRIYFDFLFHTSILVIACSEVVAWMDIYGFYKDSFKLALSILCGSYSLLLIIIGILHKKKYLRISAISLFGITLLKLFFYDIAHLETIAKTIVFIALGILLLIISFVYNKYKNVIGDETKD
jgi:hypothetical protein